MWKDIESAPRDGEVVDLWSHTGSRFVSAWWSDAEQLWHCGAARFTDDFFTHWMRLTDPQGRFVGRLELKTK